MPKTLNEWLEFIDQLHIKKIDMSLDRVAQVAHNLNLFPFEPFCITIAGTNGKGTTAGFLESTLTHSGYHVGTMASPHLLRFNERIRIDAKALSDNEICQAFEKVNQARQEITLSYFEFVTLAGLYLFKIAKIDIALLEVGMGGRLDAVNIIDPHLAIITNIALDHMDYLGTDRESIGREKAGIIRPNIPVIFGEIDMPNSIRELIEMNHNQLFQFGKDYGILEKQNLENIFTSIRMTKEGFVVNHENILPLIPIENVANAIKALEIIRDMFPVTLAILKETISSFSLAGRWQVLDKPFTHIFDVAHNPHGMIALKRFLQKHPCHGKTYAIFSMLKTKDIRQSLAMMNSMIDYWYLAPLKQMHALNKAELEQVAQQTFPNSYKSFTDIAETYEYAKQRISQNDRLVIFGSFHTVAEVWQLIV